MQFEKKYNAEAQVSRRTILLVLQIVSVSPLSLTAGILHITAFT